MFWTNARQDYGENKRLGYVKLAATALEWKYIVHILI